VLLDKNGHVSVTDFGFAFLVAGSLPNRQSLGGTAGYIAPEVLLHGGQPTPAADIYALGILMWMLATGRSLNTLEAEQPLDEPLRTAYSICRRCIANDPKQRYGSAKELIDDRDRIDA
jgi:serine/threonine-protein kinase